MTPTLNTPLRAEPIAFNHLSDLYEADGTYLGRMDSEKAALIAGVSEQNQKLTELLSRIADDEFSAWSDPAKAALAAGGEK